MKRSFLVIGLSAMGETLVRALAARGQRVIAIDKLRERSDRFIPFETVISCTGDATQAGALSDVLGREHIDEAVVAIGGNFLEAEMVAETLRGLQDSRGEPQIGTITVIANRRHRRELLERLDYKVLSPLLRAASSLALRMAVPSVHEFFVLDDDPDSRDFGVGEFILQGGGEVDFKQIEEEASGIRILGLRRVARGPILALEPTVFAGWRLVVAGGIEDLRRFGQTLRELLPPETRP